MNSTIEIGLLIALTGIMLSVANFMKAALEAARNSERRSVSTEKEVQLLATKIEGEITLLKHRVLSLEGYLSKETSYTPRRAN